MPKRKSPKKSQRSPKKRQTIEGVDSRRRRNPDNEIERGIKPSEPEIEDSERFYVIEKLLDMRTSSTGQEFLVRWQNYQPEFDSWEPRKELEANAIDMINEYERKTNLLPDEELHCVCNRPYRFEQGGMIECFKCRSWFHFSCLNINMEEANSFARYYCHNCRATNSNLKNLIKQDKMNTVYGSANVL